MLVACEGSVEVDFLFWLVLTEAFHLCFDGCLPLGHSHHTCTCTERTPLTNQRPLSPPTTQLSGGAVASAVLCPAAVYECCVGTLGGDRGQSFSWLCRFYCWFSPPNAQDDSFCVWNPLCPPAHPPTFDCGKQWCIQMCAENQSTI